MSQLLPAQGGEAMRPVGPAPQPNEEPNGQRRLLLDIPRQTESETGMHRSRRTFLGPKFSIGEPRAPVGRRNLC